MRRTARSVVAASKRPARPPRSAIARAQRMSLLAAVAGAVALLVACERGGDGEVPAAASQAPAAALPTPGGPTADTPAVDTDTAGAAYERLYTVQVAALVEPDSARSLADEMRDRGLPVFTSETREDGRVLHRVRVGATPSLDEARSLGRWLTREFDWPVWVGLLEPPDEVSSGAVEATRGFLRGS